MQAYTATKDHQAARPVDEALVTELYTAYATDVLRFCYFYLGDRSRAEDIMQDTFLRLYEKKPALAVGAEKAWLFTVALNLCRDHWRGGWFKRVVLGDDTLNMIPGDSEIERLADKQALMQAIYKLAPAYKETILLFYYQGLSIEDIARMLHTSQGTVSSRLTRARAKLKDFLGGSDQDESIQQD